MLRKVNFFRSIKKPTTSCFEYTSPGKNLHIRCQICRVSWPVIRPGLSRYILVHSFPVLLPGFVPNVTSVCLNRSWEGVLRVESPGLGFTAEPLPTAFREWEAPGRFHCVLLLKTLFPSRPFLCLSVLAVAAGSCSSDGSHSPVNCVRPVPKRTWSLVARRQNAPCGAPFFGQSKVNRLVHPKWPADWGSTLNKRAQNPRAFGTTQWEIQWRPARIARDPNAARDKKTNFDRDDQQIRTPLLPNPTQIEKSGKANDGADPQSAVPIFVNTLVATARFGSPSEGLTAW